MISAVILALAASSAAAQDGPIKYYGPNDPIPPGAVVPVPLAPNRRPMPRVEPVYILNPEWARQPQPEVPEAVETLPDGTRVEVVVTCGFLPDGVLRDCGITSDSHPHVGFGAAVYASLPDARLSSRTTADTRPDAKVRFAVRMTIVPEPADE